MKLAAKLILVFLVGVLAIVSLFAWQTIRNQNAWENQQTETHINDLVTTLRPAIESAYRDGGTVTVRQAIEISTRQLQGTQMRWIDGREVKLPQTQITASERSSVSITDKNGSRTAYSYVPLSIDGKDTGAIEISHPMSEQDAHMQRSFVASILSLLGVAALSAAVIYFGGVKLVGKPLDRLIDQVNEIGEGNLSQPSALTTGDELGKLAGAISQMSHRLNEQQAAIRHTDRLGTVGTLAAGMAHELGTPLNVVSGRAGLIASGKLSTNEIEASAHAIKTEADRMTLIIRQLLDFARQSPSAHQSLDLNELVVRTCELMKPLASKSSVDLRLDLTEVVLPISGDSAQIQQVITNLIVNAVQAMPSGGEITIASSQAEGHLGLTVTDNGVGISNDDAQHVFEPFFTTKDVGEGTGLGLSIAYGIIREHGGDIRVESSPGAGTTFYVQLPQVGSTNESKEHH